MTATKTQNIKDELNDESWKSYPIKVEDVKCKYSDEDERAEVKLEPEEHEYAFASFPEAAEQPKKYSRPPPKTPAERKRAQREREKQLKQELGLIRVRGPPKSAAERKRAQREREKQMRMQIDLLYPKRLKKIPGESRKERIERERQLKLELGLIRPKGPPKTAAERKRAQREREKQMKLEVGLVGLRAATEIKGLQKEKKQLMLQKPLLTEYKQNHKEKIQQKTHLEFSKPKSLSKTSAQVKQQQQLRKELKPLSINTPNVPTEIKSIKSILKLAEWHKEDCIPKSKLQTGENVKPVNNLEFVDCSRVSRSNQSVALNLEEESHKYNA